MKAQKQIDNHYSAASRHRKSKTIISQQKFKSRSQLLIEEYQDPCVPNEKLYVIDKVVRMRALQGRYGVDHSEILNYEFEQANKERQDHMNLLVYKRTGDGNKENTLLHKTHSNAIFERLTEKEIDELKRANIDI